MVSVYDIAQLTGVSATTVSNVLNGRGRFSKKTRDLVLKVADEQGYVVNLAARGLHSGRSHTAGIITTDVSNDYFASIVLELERLMRASGYTSFICNTMYDPNQLVAYVQELRQRNSDGLFIVGGTAPDNLATLTSQPLVLIDFYSSGALPVNSATVRTDLFQSTSDQVTVLARYGCQRIAILLLDAPRNYRPGHPIYQGYRAGLAACGLPFDSELEIVGPHLKKSRIESRELVLDLIDREVVFDGIVAVGDRQALGAVEALQERGLVPGQDVRVIGLDNSLYSQLYTPAISTVERNTDEMARAGAKAMLAMIEGKEPETREFTIPYRIIERATTLGA